jgi:hypothetical protein
MQEPAAASVSHYWGWIAHSPVKQATAPSAGSAGVSPPDAQVVARLLEVARDEDPELGLFLRWPWSWVRAAASSAASSGAMSTWTTARSSSSSPRPSASFG